MPKASRREIEESFDREGYILDEEDEALLRHVLLEDQNPQGLHRGGRKDEIDAEEDNYLHEFQR
jgi:hypothetical protein